MKLFKIEGYSTFTKERQVILVGNKKDCINRLLELEARHPRINLELIKMTKEEVKTWKRQNSK